MNIEESIEILKEFKKTGFHTLMIKYNENRIHTNKIIEDAIETLLTAYEKEKEENKRAKELYMQHNQMIIDILKECDYMIKNRYYMNDMAIRQHAEKIKDIAKYYIKEPEWKEE